MKDLSIIAGIELDRLFEAAETVRNAFAPLKGLKASEKRIGEAESRSRDAFKIIYHNLFAIAYAEIESLSVSPGYLTLGAASHEFEEIAYDTAEIPFARRKTDGLLEIVGLILRFFSGEDPADAAHLFLFLKGITDKNLAQRIKKIYRIENRPIYYINLSVSRHIQSNPRYERRNKKIVDLNGRHHGASREATLEEVISLCCADVKTSDPPGRVVDCIFDAISRHPRFRSSLHISTLRSAVYELLKENFTVLHRGPAGSDPMQDYLEKEMLRLAGEALEETAATYGWREGGSAEFKDLYKKVAWDILKETIVEGSRPSFSSVFEKYTGKGERNVFRKKHMGSFQNFWKVFWCRFIKKFRADD